MSRSSLTARSQHRTRVLLRVRSEAARRAVRVPHPGGRSPRRARRLCTGTDGAAQTCDASPVEHCARLVSCVVRRRALPWARLRPPRGGSGTLTPGLEGGGGQETEGPAIEGGFAARILSLTSAGTRPNRPAGW